MSILDTAILVGQETTYGTQVAPARGYEGTGDSFKREQDNIDATGFRAGLQATRADRRRVVNMGGAGTIELAVLDQSMLMLLDSAFSGTTQSGSGAAKTFVFSTASAEPGKSMTIQLQRAKVEGGVDVFTHLGSVVTDLTLTQEVGQDLMLKVGFDCQDVRSDVAAATPQYVSGATPFIWADATMTVNGNVVEPTKFEFSMDHKLKTDRRYLRGSVLKRRPRRGDVPGLTGSLSVDYTDNSLYTLWTSGAVFPVSIAWTGKQIGAGPDVMKVQLDLAACMFTDGSPVSSLSDLTKEDLAFDVLHDGTNPAAKLTVVTSDTAI